jgi:signal recognition particle subunit SRP54
MVLSELGARISESLSKLSAAPSGDESALRASVNDIARALLSADVSFPIVAELQKRIMADVQLQLSEDADVARLVEKAVFDGMVAILDPGVKPFRPKRKRPNVIMFVGLQVRAGQRGASGARGRLGRVPAAAAWARCPSAPVLRRLRPMLSE